MRGRELQLPAGALLRFAETAYLGQSLATVAAKLRESGCGLVVVLADPVLAGVVTEASIAESLANGCSPDDPLDDAVRPACVISPYATGADALRRFMDDGPEPLVVADDRGHVLGVLAPSDLFPKPPERIRPAMIGGMATPFGVYLTTGTERAGAGGLALVATGMLLFTMFLGSAIVSEEIAYRLFDTSMEWLAGPVVNLLPIVLFLAAMRLLPLAGTHAAEHKVVHAIERGEELSLAAVRRMPRVHPRCGTNLAVGAGIFLGIFGSRFVADDQLRLLLAGIVTLFFWRPLGGFVQQFITTKPPTDKQLEGGIAVGNQLLDRYRTTHHTTAAPWVRLWNSGMFHVMAGASVCAALAALIGYLIGVDVPI